MAEEQRNVQEQIGFHKGALATLAKEREEMLRIVSIVEQLMSAHIKALKELGVDIEAMARKAREEIKAREARKPIDEMLK